MIFLNPNLRVNIGVFFSSVHWDAEINFIILFLDIRSKWSKL